MDEVKMLNRLAMEDIGIQKVKSLCLEYGIKYDILDVTVSQRLWGDNSIVIEINDRNVGYSICSEELERLNVKMFETLIASYSHPMIQEIREEQLILGLAGVK